MDSWRISSVFSQYGQSPNVNNSDRSNEDDDEEEEEDEETNYLEWQALCLTTASTLVYYYEMYIHKEPCHYSIHTGSKLIKEILEGNETRCYQDFYMYKSRFYRLCVDFVNQYGLVPTPEMTVY